MFSKVKALLSKLTIAHATKTVWVIVIVALSFIGGMMFWKAKAVVVPQQHYSAPVVINNVEQTERIVKVMLTDTVRPVQNFFSGLTKITLAPMTDVTYLPMNSVDSTIFSRFWLITGVTYSGNMLHVESVNLPTRAVRHQDFKVSHSTFDIGTNSSSVWVVRHKQWLAWDGLEAGGGYYGSGAYVALETGVTLFRTIDLSGRLTTTQYPWQLEVKWRIF